MKKFKKMYLDHGSKIQNKIERKGKKGKKPTTIAGRLTHKQVFSHTSNLQLAMVGMGSCDTLNKRLWRSYNCKMCLYVLRGDEREGAQPGQINLGMTCKLRWCSSCSSYMSMQRRSFYLPDVQDLKDAVKKGDPSEGLFFVTLTQPNVFWYDLNRDFDQMRVSWRLLYRLANKLFKNGTVGQLSGMWSLECTIKPLTVSYLKGRKKYLEWSLEEALRCDDKDPQKIFVIRVMLRKIERMIEKLPALRKRVARLEKEGRLFTKEENPVPYGKARNEWQELVPQLFEYHPHRHLLVKGKANAEWIVDQHLKRFPTALRKSQDIRPLSSNTSKALLEIVKYISKPFVSGHMLDPRAKMAYLYLHRALKGRRVFGTFGGVRKASEARLKEWLEDRKEEGLSVDEFLEKVIEKEPHVLPESQKDLYGKFFRYERKALSYLNELGEPFAPEYDVGDYVPAALAEKLRKFNGCTKTEEGVGGMEKIRYEVAMDTIYPCRDWEEEKKEVSEKRTKRNVKKVKGQVFLVSDKKIEAENTEIHRSDSLYRWRRMKKGVD